MSQPRCSTRQTADRQRRCSSGREARRWFGGKVETDRQAGMKEDDDGGCRLVTKCWVGCYVHKKVVISLFARAARWVVIFRRRGFEMRPRDGSRLCTHSTHSTHNTHNTHGKSCQTGCCGPLNAAAATRRLRYCRRQRLSDRVRKGDDDSAKTNNPNSREDGRLFGTLQKPWSKDPLSPSPPPPFPFSSASM